MPSNTYTVIEYGAQNIKVLAATKSGKTIHVHRMVLLPAPENTFENGAFEDPSVRAITLKSYFTRYGMKSKDTIITISSPSVMIREFSVPSNKPSVVRDVINVEAQQIFPVDINTCSLDFKMGPKAVDDDGKPVYSAIVAAVPNELVEGCVWAANQAGLDVFSVDIAPDCVVKLYNSYAMQSGQEIKNEKYTTVFVDIGATMTNVAICMNDVLKYNKVLPFGSQSITYTIAENDALTNQQAEKAKYLYSIPAEFPEGAVEKDIRIASKLGDFIDDLSIFFEFHATRKTGNRIDEVVIYGGGALLGNLDKYLRKVLNMPVLKGIILDNVTFDNDIENSQEMQIMFYNCIGALVNL